MKQLLIALTLLTLTTPALATDVIEANPTKVLIITDNKGDITIVQPRELDYDFALKSVDLEILQSEVDTDNQSIFRKIFGKKCRRGK